MSEQSRQQRRKIEREQVKIGRGLLADGIDAGFRREQAVAVARVLAAKLGERGNEARASEAAALAQSLAEASLKSQPGKAVIACKRGCGYCCHTFVSVLPPEVFRLARAVRAGRAAGLDPAAVRSRAEPLRGVGPRERIGAKLACPLLVDGACSVYAERPLACRQATSLSLADCIDEYENTDADGGVQVSSAHLAHASNAQLVLLGAMKAAGLPIDAFELSSALCVALAVPDAERRWLAGEDVFHALPHNLGRSPEIAAAATRVAAALTS